MGFRSSVAVALMCVASFAQQSGRAMAAPPNIKVGPAENGMIVATAEGDGAEQVRWTVVRLLNGRQEFLKSGSGFNADGATLTITGVDPEAGYLIGAEFDVAGSPRLLSKSIDAQPATPQPGSIDGQPANGQAQSPLGEWARKEIERVGLSKFDVRFGARSKEISTALRSTVNQSQATNVAEFEKAALTAAAEHFPGDGQPAVQTRLYALFAEFSKQIVNRGITDLQGVRNAYLDLAKAFDGAVLDRAKTLEELEKELNALVGEYVAQGGTFGTTTERPKKRKRLCECLSYWLGP